MGLLDGKVAIITGAGGGIGRCHALLFAQEGAKVVVNDLGGAVDGSGGDGSMADQVVKEIKAAGGEAVANYASVATMEGATSIAQTALDTYGRADILVNNAGILRDKTLLKMDEGQFDLVIAVHLKGTFACTRVFADHVKERAEKGDRGAKIVNTSSYAGLMGNFGQTNYAAAKAGIYGMTKVWEAELAKYGVDVNCIAPMAKTRMTDDIAMVPDHMKAEHVSPMVLFLSSPLSDGLSGKVYGIHGQQLLEYKMLMTDGVTKDGDAFWTPAEIAAKLDAIGASGPTAGAAPAAAAKPLTDDDIVAKAFAMLPEVFVPAKAKGWNAVIQFDLTGGTPWTVTVADGTCTTAEGKQGTATCVVTVDVATYAKIVKGEEKAEKAFMAGKIKASNLGDMMKFGGAFDMKKAKELAKAEAAKAKAAGGAPAAPKPLTDNDIVAKAFSMLPEVFVPAKAKGWNAVIQFDLTGGTPWTVTVGDGKCTTAEGKHGTATCVVTVDVATYAQIVKGKEKAEKAFMAGKIKASNLGDMMKFGGAFDMKKAKELAKAEAAKATAGAAPAAAPAAAAAPAGPQGQVDAAFGFLPDLFKPASVSGWNAVVHFKLEGGDDWTVTIQDGTCTTAKGLTGSATCTVTTSLDAYAQIVSGKLKAEQAFMTGKLKASNLGDMMKFGKAFDMKKAKELLVSGAAAAAAAASSGGMNREFIGRGFRGSEPVFIRPEHTALFATATQDENPRYTGDDAVAPPVFPVRILKDVLFSMIGEEDLGADLLNLVHGEQDMRFHRPLRPWDLCATRASVTAIEDKATGQLLRVAEEVWSGGELAVSVNASMFIRDPSKKKDKSAKTEAPAEEAREIAFSQQVTVPADAGSRYAEASLDNNPIHTDPQIATMAGFPGVILQGLCTMAFAGKAVVDELLGGDTARLERLAVRFSKPVLMGDVLTTEGWAVDEQEGIKSYGFRVKNQDGVEVISNGIAEIAAN